MYENFYEMELLEVKKNLITVSKPKLIVFNKKAIHTWKFMKLSSTSKTLVI